MFNIGEVPLLNKEAIYYGSSYILILIIGIILSTPILTKLLNKLEKSNSKSINMLTSFIYIFILILSTASLVSDSFNPFLYFRF